VIAPQCQGSTIHIVKPWLQVDAAFRRTASLSARKHLPYEIIRYCNISGIPYIWSLFANGTQSSLLTKVTARGGAPCRPMAQPVTPYTHSVTEGDIDERRCLGLIASVTPRPRGRRGTCAPTPGADPHELPNIRSPKGARTCAPTPGADPPTIPIRSPREEPRHARRRLGLTLTNHPTAPTPEGDRRCAPTPGAEPHQPPDHPTARSRTETADARRRLGLNPTGPGAAARTWSTAE
jgi:hypothetical protein